MSISPKRLHRTAFFGIGLIAVLLVACGEKNAAPTATMTPTSIAITPALVTITKGQTANLAATATYSDGKTADVTQSVIWTSLAANMASVNPTGVVTGVAIGSTTISATQNGVTSPPANFAVSAPDLISISVVPSAASMVLGGTTALTATGSYSDNTSADVSKLVTWKSDKTKVVKINRSGIAKGVGIGDSLVTAILDKIESNAATVTVAYSVGGTLSGLALGNSIALSNNNVDTLALTADGSFNFPTGMAKGSAFNLAVAVPPTNQPCTHTYGSGKVQSSNVTGLTVICGFTPRGDMVKTASLVVARRDHTATLLPGGKILVTGGVGVTDNLASTELFDPVSERWSATGISLLVVATPAVQSVIEGSVRNARKLASYGETVLKPMGANEEVPEGSSTDKDEFEDIKEVDIPDRDNPSKQKKPKNRTTESYEDDVVSISARLIDLPRLKCSCGQDLQLSQPVSPLPDKITQLIDVSVRALNHVKFGWQHEHVRAYLRSHFEGRADTLAKSYLSTLSKALHFKSSSSSALLTSTIRGQGGANYIMSLRNTFGFGKAPECCALLAALDIDFDRAKRALEQVTNIERKRRWPDFPTALMTVGAARRELLLRVKRFPSRHVSDNRNLYWFLRINDAEWMQRRFPEKSPRKFSAALDDRKSLIRLFSDTRFLPYERRRNALTTVAWVRANIRDQEWLADQLDQLLLGHRLRVIDDRHDNLKQRASDIANAIKALSGDGQKPRRILISHLAARVGLTQYQVSTTMRDFPYVRNDLIEVNKDYIRRQLLWAYRQLVSEGTPLSIANIHERAELRSNGKYSKLVRKIVETSRDESISIAVKHPTDTKT